MLSVQSRFEQPSRFNWRKIEDEFGVALPVGFKSLISKLGSGNFGDGFVLTNPAASGMYRSPVCLSMDNLTDYREAVAFLEQRIGIRLFPRKNGLILIGGKERRQLMLGVRGNSYSVLYLLDHDDEEIREVGEDVGEFLYKLYFDEYPDRWALSFGEDIWGRAKSRGNRTFPFFTPSPTRGDLIRPKKIL